MDAVYGDVSTLDGQDWQDFDLVSDFAEEMIARNSEEIRDPTDDEVGLMEFDINDDPFNTGAASVHDPRESLSATTGLTINPEPVGESALSIVTANASLTSSPIVVAAQASPISQRDASLLKPTPLTTEPSTATLATDSVKILTLDELVADFYEKESTSELKKKKIATSGMYFFVKGVPTNKMVLELIQNKVLHRLIVLDHIARCIDESQSLSTGSYSTMDEYHHGKAKLNGALCEYLEAQYKDKIIVLRHFKPTTVTQESMVNEEITQLRKCLQNAKKGHAHSTSLFHKEGTDTAKWLNEVCRLLLVDAQRVDQKLGDQTKPGQLVVFGEHLNSKLNLLIVLLDVHAAIHHVDELNLRKDPSEYGFAVNPTVLTPGGVIVSTVSGPLTPNPALHPAVEATPNQATVTGAKRAGGNAELSAADKRTRTGAGTASLSGTVTSEANSEQLSEAPSPQPSSDTAYWAKIDPLHQSTRHWCQPGMVVGIYPAGAGPPSVRALFVCVVTSMPTFLELPVPFAGAERPVGLFLQIAIAVGVLGRVPVRMEDSVLERLYRSDASQELFWTATGGADGQGCVDFAEEGRPFDYETAKYIGYGEFDKKRFENGKLKEDFQGVHGIPVMVAYRAVSETQIFKRIDAVKALVVETKKEMVDKIDLVQATTDKKIDDLRNEVYELLPSAQTPNLLSLLLFILLSALLFWHLLLQPGAASHSLPRGTPILKLSYARLFKNGTTINHDLPSVPSEFFLRTDLRANITHTMFEQHHKSLSTPALPTPVVLVTAPGGYGKSTEVLSLVQQRIVYERFPGGVYYLECSYHLGDEKKLLEDLAKQMFGSFLSYNDTNELVDSLRHAVVGQGEQILVVLDNVATAPIVQSVARLVSKNGLVLITSRRRNLHNGAALTEVRELHGQEIVDYMESHNVRVNGSLSANIDDVIHRTHGVPLALSLVSKLHAIVGMPWEEISSRIDSRFGEVGVHEVEDLERLDIRGAYHNSTFACIAVSVDVLSERLREKFVPLVLLPVGISVSTGIVGAIWNVTYPTSHLTSLFDHSLVVYDANQGTVRLHDLVREYLEHLVRTNVNDSIATHERFEALISYMLSSASLGPLVATSRDLNAEVGVYYRHWDYLRAVLHPHANKSVQHHTALEHVRAHSAHLQEVAPYSLQRCKYAYESSLALRVLGKASSDEMELIDQAMRNVDEAVARNLAPHDELLQLQACQAELIDKYADLMISLPDSVMPPQRKRDKQLQLYLQARDLKLATIGSETREYTRTLNSIGLVIEQMLVLHKESHGDASTFNQTLLQLANSSYTEMLEIVHRLIDIKKAEWFHVGVVYNNLANMQSKLENYVAVEPYLLQAIEYYNRPLVFLVPSNTCADLIMNAEANIGINCYYMRNYARAKEILVRASDYFVKRHYPSNHVYSVKIAKHLRLLDELRNVDRAGL